MQIPDRDTALKFIEDAEWVQFQRNDRRTVALPQPVSRNPPNGSWIDQALNALSEITVAGNEVTLWTDHTSKRCPVKFRAHKKNWVPQGPSAGGGMFIFETVEIPGAVTEATFGNKPRGVVTQPGRPIEWLLTDLRKLSIRHLSREPITLKDLTDELPDSKRGRRYNW